MPNRFHMVDVFAESAYTGNPLPVVIGAETLSDGTMQQIAAEMNFSETTFVASEPEADGGYRVRLFTPAREIAFAGHPILGTAAVIRDRLATGTPDRVQLNLAEARVPVTFERGGDGEVAWFRAPPMTLGATVAPAAMAGALGLDEEDLDMDAPVQQVAAGTAAMIVPLSGLDALHRARLDLAAYAPLAAAGFPPLVYLFCWEAHDPANDLCVRFFFEAHGVREDPATGNGAAFLGAYLLSHGLCPASGFALRIEQGHALRRPSRVLLRGRMHDGRPEVEVGGRVIPTVQGELL